MYFQPPVTPLSWVHHHPAPMESSVSASTVEDTKLPAKEKNANNTTSSEKCCFCESAPAAVRVQLPSTRKHRRQEKPKPYCLLHYYTTHAVRVPSNKVSFINEDEVQQQLLDGEFGGMQQLFAQAFTELQQELSETSARAFTTHQSDPLAILHDLRGKPKKRPKKTKKAAAPINSGGFLPSVALPERLLQNQQEQQKLQAQQIHQIKNTQNNPYKRRKSSGKSIWNLALQPPTAKETAAVVAAAAASSNATTESGVVCSCGSHKVVQSGSMTQRNSELTKGETWGNKDRSDALVARYQCQACGKVWNEEA